MLRPLVSLERPTVDVVACVAKCVGDHTLIKLPGSGSAFVNCRTPRDRNLDYTCMTVGVVIVATRAPRSWGTAVSWTAFHSTEVHTVFLSNTGALLYHEHH